tara:strand:+ start:185 stop:862 length:678 start_codon:yes stop_codon:yes gene_type:complete
MSNSCKYGNCSKCQYGHLDCSNCDIVDISCEPQKDNLLPCFNKQWEKKGNCYYNNGPDKMTQINGNIDVVKLGLDKPAVKQDLMDDNPLPVYYKKDYSDIKYGNIKYDLASHRRIPRTHMYLNPQDNSTKFGGCESTRYGCCDDNKTAKNSDGSNCSNILPGVPTPEHNRAQVLPVRTKCGTIKDKCDQQKVVPCLYYGQYNIDRDRHQHDVTGPMYDYLEKTWY